MTPQFQGRFCQNCQKTVVDFTQMSDAEVVEWLGKETGNTCGRFSHTQIEKPLILISGYRQSHIWKTASLVLAAWLSAKPVKADISPQVTATFQTSTTGLKVEPKKEPADSTIIIKGKVVDGATQETMPGVTVQLKGTTIAAPTSVDGVFTISLPTGLDLENSFLVFSFIGYDSQEKPVKHFLKNPKAEMVLSMSTSIMGEVVVIRQFTPRGLYYSVRSFFGYTIPNLFR
ncbi:hypothetical protein TH63_16950 [Rufibacter radiotolerans]|uniref:Carboxypeptidase-like protein n=2 Tax=Rufibacter radiotolerans TaxID=1379910 RepID=A0A0H4W911_9BACT|nr:hypothetical protein TH63_16950 [Rufibacter radiotolerans]